MGNTIGFLSKSVIIAHESFHSFMIHCGVHVAKSDSILYVMNLVVSFIRNKASSFFLLVVPCFFFSGFTFVCFCGNVG